MSAASSSAPSPARAKYSRASGRSPRANRAAYSSNRRKTSSAMSEGLPELGMAAMESLVDSIAPQPQLLGDLLDLETAEVAELQHLARLLGQRGEQVGKVVTGEDAVARILDGRLPAVG